MNFSDHYFTEAKLSAWQQVKNIFSKEKTIKINLDKDIIYIGEVSKGAFDDINRKLSESYKSHGELKKRKKAASQGSDKILARMSAKKSLDIEAGQQIINVFKADITGTGGKLEGTVQAAAAYETGRHVIHYGYLVTIITKKQKDEGDVPYGNPEEDDDLSQDKYYIAGDKRGLKFFKEMFGTNLDMYVASNMGEIYRRPKKKKEKETEGKPLKDSPSEKKVYGYVEVQGGPEVHNTILDEIEKEWAKSGKFGNKFSSIKENNIRFKDGMADGQNFIIEGPEPTTVGVYSTDKRLIIIFYDTLKTIEKAKQTGIFNLKSIQSPQSQIFSQVKTIQDISKI